MKNFFSSIGHWFAAVGRALKKDVFQNKTSRIAVSVIAVCLVAVIAGLVGKEIYMKAPVKAAKTVTVNLPVEELRIGVISDTQLPSYKPKDGKEDLYITHLRDTLNLLKEQKVNMIIHAGDFCDAATSYGYKSYLKVFEEVFPDEEKAPYTFYVMGNHDMWFPADYSSIAPKHRLYKRVMGVAPNTHVVVNGFHFIGASPDDTSNADGYTGTMKNWIQSQIDEAEKDAKEEGKPIFLITHHNIAGSVYGADQWGDERLRQAVQPYENIVSISGHSHYSILDERSMNQNMITAFTTQSLAYIDMESGMFNAFKGIDRKTGEFDRNNCYSTAPARDDERPMCLIMNVNDKETTVERWNVIERKEEKADQRWTLSYPLSRGNFAYRSDDRTMASLAPVFPSDAKITLNPAIQSNRAQEDGSYKTLPGISFPAASHPDLVNSYIVKMKNLTTGKTYTYHTYSDYYLGVDAMAKTVDWALDPTLPSGKYEFTVYATESFGKTSQPIRAQLDWTQPEIKIAETAK